MVWIDNARILAIFAVVVIHISAVSVVGNPDVNSSAWWAANVYDSFARWCVPVFVMISGALLLSNSKVESMAVFYKKRLSRLLIPLVFWSVFFLGWTYLSARLHGGDFPLRSLGNLVLLGKPYYHMWFLFMIISLYLVTPFVRIVMRNCSRTELTWLVVGMFGVAVLNIVYRAMFNQTDLLFINWFLIYLPYLLLGSLIATSTYEPGRGVLWAVFLVSGALTAVGSYLLIQRYGIDRGLYLYNYLGVTVIPMSISAFYLLKRFNAPLVVNAKVTRQVADIVLGIYLIHPVFIDLFSHFGINSLTLHPIYTVPALVVVVFLLSAGVAWVIHQIPYLRRIE